MKRRGLTLFEMVVSLAIFSLALLVLGQLFQSYANWNSSLSTREEPILQAREAVQSMIAEAQGAIAINAASATSLVLTVVEPGQIRFPAGAASWTPSQACITVSYQVNSQGLTRTQGANPPLLLAQRVEGMQATLASDHRLQVSLSVRVGAILRTISHNGFYWVKTL